MATTRWEVGSARALRWVSGPEGTSRAEVGAHRSFLGSPRYLQRINNNTLSPKFGKISFQSDVFTLLLVKRLMGLEASEMTSLQVTSELQSLLVNETRT